MEENPRSGRTARSTIIISAADVGRFGPLKQQQQ
jgi:hypothetical protein